MPYVPHQQTAEDPSTGEGTYLEKVAPDTGDVTYDRGPRVGGEPRSIVSRDNQRPKGVGRTHRDIGGVARGV